MASEKGPPPDPPSARRRRPPPVINLEATEVQSAAEPRVEASAPPPEPPRDPPPDRRPFAWLPEELSSAHVSAGIAGATGALFLVLLLWLVGALSGGGNSSTDLGPRLASIEKKLNDLVKDFAARPAPASVDPKAIDDALARLAKLESAQARLESGQARLESAQATPRAPVTDPVVLGRLSATENAVNSLADNVAAVSRRIEGIDGTLRDTSNRIDKLTASLAELQITARAAAIGSDRAVRLAVAAAALRATVERGDSFSSELAIVKPLASNAGVLAPLEPFAATGLPSNAVLAQELTVIIQPMLRAAGAPARDGNFLDRLQANAEKIVRIRPVDDARGDDRSAILARIEQRAAQANIPGALAELAKLPPDARAAAQGWIAKAESRNSAIEVSRRFAADAMAALKTTP